jgi:hypothetical protein
MRRSTAIILAVMTKDDLKSKADIIKELAGMAHERRTSA